MNELTRSGTIHALPALLQLAGGGFPTGAFSHSYGLETLVQEGRVRDVSTFGQWLGAHVTYALAPTDGAGVGLAQRAVVRGDWDGVTRIDRLLTALKLAPEVRRASLGTGQAMLRAAREVFGGEATRRYGELVTRGAAFGNAAVVFASVAADLRIEPAVSMLAFLWCAAANVTATATRLVPLGAMAAQRVLRELEPRIQAAALGAERLREATLGTSAVMQEIAALRHERLYSRLFMS